MINHYGKFIPHLHQIKKPLEDLTKKNKPWVWNSEHDEAIHRIKEVMLSPLLLEHYDPSKTLIVAADACATGIGGVLLQRDNDGFERAVYHMSQSLTDAQRNYSQLEKEALAIVTAVERFHKFVWGRKFILQTDHKPLVSLLQTENTKGLKPSTAARLKRWAIRLLGYNFQIEYIRTQDFGQADALSRLIENFRQDNLDEIQVAYVRAVEKELQQIKNYSIDQFGKDLRSELKSATLADSDLMNVIEAIKNNWASSTTSPTLEHFRKRQDNLSIVDHTILLGDRVVIPRQLQPRILTSLHLGHPGIRRMKQLAREFVYWPKISEDIENLVRHCDACALSRKLPVKVPLNPWPTPSKPLERLHVDFAGPIDGQYLLIFVDAYSKFIDVAITSSISASRTIELCREVFSRYGPPEVLISDHGTQFTANLFAEFCKSLHISHLFSAVNHPQSNGQAERMVDTIKRAISKNPSNWKKELQDFLYSYRYTPCASAPNGKSPAELFFGRRIISPFSKLLPRPETTDDTTSTTPTNNSFKMQSYFDQHHGARQRNLQLGDRVVVLLNNNNRGQGYISGICSKNRYLIYLDNGKTVERHINHIWEGGSTRKSVHDSSLSDDWMFYGNNTNPDLVPISPTEQPAPPNHSENILDQGNHSPAPTKELVETPNRPPRLRRQPRRLVLDPNSKSYVQN